MKTLFFLLVMFQFKHFIADYLLQGEYMLGKFKAKFKEALLPLASHCSVHLVFTFVITFRLTDNAYLGIKLGLFDFIVHFIMDRIKADPKLLGRYKAMTGEEYVKAKENIKEGNLLMYKSDSVSNVNIRLFSKGVKLFDAAEGKLKSNKYFWWSLGVDQMVHHLTDLAIVYFMVTL